MKKTSAGVLLFRWQKGDLEVLLVHPGGPFFAKKDLGVWSIPKGELKEGEEPLVAAKREFFEETGSPVDGEFLPLTAVTQKSGKTVLAWAVQGDFDTLTVTSNNFTIEWPPKSGNLQCFPEVDKAGWFTMDNARQKINPAQAAFLSELKVLLNRG